MKPFSPLRLAVFTSALVCSVSFPVIAQSHLLPSVQPDGELISVTATVTGQLKTRSYTLTIYAGANGPLYTVQDNDGNLQGGHMTEELLAKRFPVLRVLGVFGVFGAGLDIINNRAPAGDMLF